MSDNEINTWTEADEENAVIAIRNAGQWREAAIGAANDLGAYLRGEAPPTGKSLEDFHRQMQSYAALATMEYTRATALLALEDDESWLPQA